MRRREFVTAGCTAAVPLVAGCSGGRSGSGTTADGSGSTVRMVDTTFDPIRLSVSPGTTVTWVNEDAVAHTVDAAQFHDVATKWSFSSGTVESGESVTYTFAEKGIYEYYCTIHGKSTMCGVVLVGDVSLGKSLPCEGSDGGGGYGY